MEDNMNDKLLKIKEKIKELAAKGTKIRKEVINKTSGKDRYYAWEDKRMFGAEARTYLLVYGFLRGMPYRKIEPKSRLDFSIPIYRRCPYSGHPIVLHDYITSCVFSNVYDLLLHIEDSDHEDAPIYKQELLDWFTADQAKEKAA
jgi:hypothetical protein